MDKSSLAPEPESSLILLSNGTDLTSSNAIVSKMRGVDGEICCPGRSIYTARYPAKFKRSADVQMR